MSASVRRLFTLVCLGVVLHAADVISVVATQPMANEKGLVPAVVVFSREDPTVQLSVPFRITGNAASDQHGGHVSAAHLVDYGNGYRDNALYPIPIRSGANLVEEEQGYSGGDPVLSATGQGGQIDSVTVLTPGYGYLPGSLPSVTVVDSNGAGAILRATVSGFVQALTIADGGVGYAVGDRLFITEGSPEVAAQIQVLSVSGLGAITGVALVTAGRGYDFTTTVQVVAPETNGAGSGAVLSTTFLYGVDTISVLASGSGYINPSVSIAPPDSGQTATATLVVGGNPLENVTVIGGGSHVPLPVVATDGTVTGAVLVPVVDDGVVTRIVVENGGHGANTPDVIFPGGTTPASARTRVRDGVIIGVAMVEAGAGYPDGVITVVITSGLTNATIRGVAVGGKVISASVVDGGSGFSTPLITIARDAATPAAAGATAVATIEAGAIVAVDVVSGGAGYSISRVPIDDNQTTDDDLTRAQVSFRVSAPDYYVLADGQTIGGRASVIAWLDPAGTGDLLGVVFFDRAATTTSLRIVPMRNGVGGGREMQVAIEPPSHGDEYIVVNEASVAQVRIGDMDDIASVAVVRPVAYPTPPSLSQEIYPLEVEGRAEFQVNVVGDDRHRRVSLEFTGAAAPTDGITVPMAQIDVDCMVAVGGKAISETVNDFAVIANKELYAPYTYGPARPGDTRVYVNTNDLFEVGSVVMFEGVGAATRVSGIYVVTSKEKETDEEHASVYVTPALASVVDFRSGSTRMRRLAAKPVLTDSGDGSLSIYDAYSDLSRLYFFAFPRAQTQTRGSRSLMAKLVEVDDYMARTPNVAGLTIADTLAIARIGYGSNAGQPATGGSFLVTLSSPFPRNIAVPFDVLASSTAVLHVNDDPNTVADETVVGDCSVEGVDASTRRGVLIIPAGSTTGSILVTPSGSAVATTAKTVDVRLAASYDYQFGPQGTSAANAMASITVAPTPLTNDPDGAGPLAAIPIRVSFDLSATHHGVEPSSGAQVKLILVDALGVALPLAYVTEVPLSVRYTVSGTAQENVNYVALSGRVILPAGGREVIIPIQVKDDGVARDDRSLTITLQGGVGYQVGANGAATVTIADGAPVLSVKTIKGAVRPRLQSTTNGQFEVTNTHPSQQPLTVAYTVSGDAQAGVDYTALVGSFTLPPSAGSFLIEVIPQPGSTTKDLQLTLSASATSSYHLDPEAASAAMTISSPSEPPTNVDNVSVYVTVARVRDAAEEPLTNGSFRFSLTNSAGVPLSAGMSVDYPISYSASGSAVKGINYKALSLVAAVPAGQLSVDVPVEPMNDNKPGGTQVVITVDPSMYPSSQASTTVSIQAAPDQSDDNTARPTVGTGGSGGCGVGSGIGVVLAGFGVALAARLRRRRDAA